MFIHQGSLTTDSLVKVFNIHTKSAKCHISALLSSRKTVKNIS